MGLCGEGIKTYPCQSQGRIELTLRRHTVSLSLSPAFHVGCRLYEDRCVEKGLLIEEKRGGHVSQQSVRITQDTSRNRLMEREVRKQGEVGETKVVICVSSVNRDHCA